MDEAVQPDVRDPAGEGRCGGLLAGSVGRRRPGHGLPEVRGVRAVRGEGGAVDAVEGTDPGRPVGQRGGLAARVGGLRVGDDERQPVTVRVVVPVGDHVRDVEQLPVQGALGHEGQHGLGEHVEVVARRQDVGLHRASVGAADADGASGPAVGAGALPGGHHVTGDQCDGVVAGGHPVGRGWGGRGVGGVGTGCRGRRVVGAGQREYQSTGGNRHTPASAVVRFHKVSPGSAVGQSTVVLCRPRGAP